MASSSYISHVASSTDKTPEAVFDPAIKAKFLSDVRFYLEHTSSRHDFIVSSVCLEDDPAIDQLFSFLAITEQKFGLSFSAIFSEDGLELNTFIAEFADSYIDAMRGVSKLSGDVHAYHHPAGLHPTDPNEFRKVHMFTDLLSTFIHYGQKRGDAEDNRPYKKGHIDEVLGFLRSYCEPFATSVLSACRLHDAGEDFDHPDGFMTKAGLSPDQKGDFFQFLCDYLDANLPPVNFPDAFRDMSLSDSSGKPFPTGAQFDLYASRKLHHSDTLRDLSKIQGAIPGYAKDRYRDVNAKLYRILSEPDPRIRMIMFVQYFFPKAFDTLSNVYSYFQMSHKAGKNAEHSEREQFKRRQMEGMVRNIVLRGMQRLGAQIAHYKINDALKFPHWDQRQKYKVMIKKITDKDRDGGGMSRAEIFEQDLFKAVMERYKNAYQEPLPENAFQIIMWRRAIHDIKANVQKAIDSGVLPDETKFMHVIDIRVLDKRPEIASRIKTIIESVITSFAPIIERGKLVAERQHPLIGDLCSVRSDEGIVKKTASFGYIVYSLRNLPEVRRDLEGLVSTTYLNQDIVAFKKLRTFLDTLQMHVGHVEKVLKVIEDELRYLATLPVAQQIQGTRSQIYSALQYFASDPIIAEQTGEHVNIFGEKMDVNMPMTPYAEEVMKLYHNCKEQIMTHMSSRIELGKFSVMISGSRKIADPQVTLPKDSNPLYGLFYYFPMLAHHSIKSIRVYRGGTQNIYTDAEAMKYLTLLPGDKVDIQLHPEQKDRKNIEKALRFARRTLYPDKDVALDS